MKNKDLPETNQRGDKVRYHNFNDTEPMKKNKNLHETIQRGDKVCFNDTEPINEHIYIDYKLIYTLSNYQFLTLHSPSLVCCYTTMGQ